MNESQRPYIGSWSYEVAAKKLSWCIETRLIHGISLTAKASLGQLLDLYGLEAQQEILKKIQRLINFEENFSFEVDLVKAHKVIRITGHITQRGNSSVEEISGTVEDISEIYSHTKSIGNLNRILSESLVIFTLSEDFKFKHMNTNFLNAYKYSYSQILHKELKELFIKQAESKNFKKIIKNLSQEKIWFGEIKTLKKNGEPIFIDIVITPVRYNEAKPIEYIACGNIVNQVAILRDDHDSQARLRTVGEISAQLIHEIMNPVTVIQGHIKILKRLTKKPGNEKRIAKSILNLEESNKYISDVFKSMRSLLSSNLQVKLTNINILCQSMVNLNCLKANQVGAELSLITNDQTHIIKTSPPQLTQVLINLLNNALDAIKGQQGKKWVNVELVSNDHNIIITTTDSGSGIPVKIADQMFNSLFTTKGSENGVGLGLGLCTKMIKLLGGKIWYNEEHPNTQFVVELPLVQNK